MTMISTSERTWFNHLGHTRAAILPSINNVDKPELGELLSPTAIDISCDVTHEGLNIDRPTGMSTFTPWWGNHEREYPLRWSTRAGLVAPVPTGVTTCAIGHDTTDPDCCFGALWDLSCKFRSPMVLVVRRGLPVDVQWSVGQPVEVIRGRWGVRNIMRFEDGPALFTVPIGVTQEAGFDPDGDTCGPTTSIVPGTTPLPCNLRLCDGHGAPLQTGECIHLSNCCDDEGESS